MENNTPVWLTKEYISRAIKNDDTTNGDINVVDLEIFKPVPKGNNYTSDIYRVKVKYYDSSPDNLITKSFIIKAPVPCSDALMVTQSVMVQKENDLYCGYLLKVNHLLKSYNEDFVTPLSFRSSEKNVLILEDLNFSGYQMAERLKRFDYEHSVVALKALAKFHAASVKLHEIEPKQVEDVGTEIFFKATSETKLFFTNSFKILADEVKLSPHLEKYSEKLTQYSESIWDNMEELMSPIDGSFNVLNHGDFWVTNMLFKYDPETQKPISVKLVDLQISRYTSPAIDLIYFLHSSVREDIRLEKSKELFDVYFKELTEKLDLFGTKRRFSREELDEHLKQRSFFELLVSVSILPWILADPDKCKIVDLETLDMENEDNAIASYYKIEPYKSIIAKRLVEYEKKGWL